MEYKVVKDFGIVKKGDVFVNESGFWEVDVENIEGTSSTRRSMVVDYSTMEELVTDGFVEKVENTHSGNVEDTLMFIEGLLSQYEDDHNEVVDKYNDQEIPTCVKVEADTVYYNMTKVLNAVRDKLIA